MSLKYQQAKQAQGILVFNNKAWFIDSAETLKAIHSVHAKKYNGMIDDLKSYLTPRETYIKNDNHSIVTITHR